MRGLPRCADKVVIFVPTPARSRHGPFSVPLLSPGTLPHSDRRQVEISPAANFSQEKLRPTRSCATSPRGHQVPTPFLFRPCSLCAYTTPHTLIRASHERAQPRQAKKKKKKRATMDVQPTPRATAPYLESYVGRNVTVVGKVAQLRGDQAVIDADGSITAHLNRVRADLSCCRLPRGALASCPSLGYAVLHPAEQLSCTNPCYPSVPIHAVYRFFLSGCRSQAGSSTCWRKRRRSQADIIVCITYRKPISHLVTRRRSSAR